MSLSVCTGGMLECPFGASPVPFSALPASCVLVEGRPAGVDTDMAPIINIPSFGTCSSLNNPTVASATSAAMGTLTPMPCVPVTTGTWEDPVSEVLIGGRPALTDGSKIKCAWGGQISVRFSGQTTVQL